jgi:uncharacterized protein YyaL (SSP411 family)
LIYEEDPQEARGLLKTIQAEYRPNTILAASSDPPSIHAPALLAERPLKDGKPTVYVCEGFVCKMPVTSISELQALL